MANITQNHQINDKISGPQSEKLLRWPEVKTRVGICRSHAHDLASKGLFPSPIKLSDRCSACLQLLRDGGSNFQIEDVHGQITAVGSKNI